jgi:hypothetical protein
LYVGGRGDGKLENGFGEGGWSNFFSAVAEMEEERIYTIFFCYCLALSFFFIHVFLAAIYS